MSSLPQRSFFAGEIDPALAARPDQVKYASGLRQLKNGYVKRQGGIANRPGTYFVDDSRFPGKKSRLVPFVYSPDPTQNYALEFGDLYLEVIRAGARVLANEAARVLTAITAAQPPVVCRWCR